MMTEADRIEIAAKRAKLEMAMEAEIDSLLNVRRKAGEAGRPPSKVVGKRTAGARMNYRKTQPWTARTRRMLKVA